jgi:hypothetical protein
MRWHRQNGNHNNPNHEAASKGVVVSQARLTVAWLIDSALRKFRTLSRPRSGRSPETIVVSFGDRHGFTVLGSAIAPHAVHESALTCPFPEQDAAAAQRRSEQRSAARAFAHSCNHPANDTSARSSER